MAETRFSTRSDISTVSSIPSDSSLNRSSDFLYALGHNGDIQTANKDRNIKNVHQVRNTRRNGKDRRKASTCTIIMFVLLCLMSLGQIAFLVIQLHHISKEQESIKNITKTNTNHIRKIEFEADQTEDTFNSLRDIQNRAIKNITQTNINLIRMIEMDADQTEDTLDSLRTIQNRGNENIHAISLNGPHELSIFMISSSEQSGYANYSQFSISDENSKYMLRISGYSGSAGDAFNHNAAIQNGQKFTTKDQDNDNFYSGNCAVHFGGGWWFNACHNAFLNGDSESYGRKWYPWADKVTDSVMMIRQTI
ncbi:uncharacterized protein LOC134683473 [Mytilus trossulus]|uniref:uncharacterized protein LOC134683473 n=1 Tax=Mytilus trossulus TaxID=6551 RepID=UPI003005D820